MLPHCLMFPLWHNLSWTRLGFCCTNLFCDVWSINGLFSERKQHTGSWSYVHASLFVCLWRAAVCGHVTFLWIRRHDILLLEWTPQQRRGKTPSFHVAALLCHQMLLCLFWRCASLIVLSFRPPQLLLQAFAKESNENLLAGVKLGP